MQPVLELAGAIVAAQHRLIGIADHGLGGRLHLGIVEGALEFLLEVILAALDLAERLTAEEVASLDTLPKNRRTVNPSFAPDWND